MRITSGKARGISLRSPKGDATRPATDAARQAIFSSLGPSIEAAHVLDLFAGTGSYGLEALSRGADSAIFVESSRNACAALKENIRSVEKAIGSTNASISTADALKFTSQKKFDFVFADPPYFMLLEEKTLAKVLALFCSLATESCMFILEAPGEFELPKNITVEEKTFAIDAINRLGKKSKGKPSQIIFKIQ